MRRWWHHPGRSAHIRAKSAPGDGGAQRVRSGRIRFLKCGTERGNREPGLNPCALGRRAREKPSGRGGESRDEPAGRKASQRGQGERDEPEKLQQNTHTKHPLWSCSVMTRCGGRSDNGGRGSIAKSSNRTTGRSSASCQRHDIWRLGAVLCPSSSGTSSTRPSIKYHSSSRLATPMLPWQRFFARRGERNASWRVEMDREEALAIAEELWELITGPSGLECWSNTAAKRFSS